MKRFLAILGSLVLATLLPGQSAALRYNPATKELQDSVVVPADKTITTNGNIVSSTAGDASKFLRGDGSYAAVTTTGSFATAADINAGTATDKAIAPDQLALTSASPAFVNGLATTKSPAQSVVYNGSAGSPVYGLAADGTGGFTVLVWCTPTSFSGYPAVAAGTDNGSPRFQITEAGKPYMSVKSGTSYEPSAASSLTLNAANFVAWRRDNGVLYVSVNGGPEASVAANVDLTAAVTKLGYSDAGNYFSGPLSVAKILGSSTAAEIAAAYRGQPPRWWFPSVPAGTQLITGDDSTFDKDTGWWEKIGTVTGFSGTVTLTGNNSRIIRNPFLVRGEKYRFSISGLSFSGGGKLLLSNNNDQIFVDNITSDGSYDFIVTGIQEFNIFYVGTGSATFGTVQVQVLGAQLYPDANQPGTGSLIRSVGNCPAYAVKSATNSWLYPSSQYERAEIDTRANSAATRQGLWMPGTQYASSALVPAAGTAPISIFIDADIPLTSPSGTQVLFSYGTYSAANTATVLLGSDGILYLDIFDGTAAVKRHYFNAVGMFGGTRIKVEYVKSSTGAWSALVNGKNLPLSVALSGDATAALNGTYILLGGLNTGSSTNAFGPGYLNAGLLFGNLTEAESQAWFATGVLPAWAYKAIYGGREFIAASLFENYKYDSFADATASGFSAVGSLGGCEANIRGAATEVFEVGGKLVVTFNAYVSSGTIFCRPIKIISGGGSYTPALVKNGLNVLVFDVETATTAGNPLGFRFYSSGAANYTISNFKMVSAGVAFQLDPQQRGIGSVGYDISGAGRNLTLGSGVTWAVPASYNLPLGGGATLTGSGTGATSLMGGNLLLSTTTDAGYKLDVNGTARVNGALSATSITQNGQAVATNSDLLTRTNGKAPARGLYFDGTAGVSVPSAISAPGTGDFFDVHRVRFPDAAAEYPIISHGAGGASYLSRKTDRTLNNCTGGTNHVSTATISDAKTAIVIRHRSAGTSKVFVDGAEVISYADAENITAWSQLGRSSYTGFVAKGEVTPIAKGNCSLTTSQIAYIAETGNIPTELLPNLVGQPAGVALITGDSSTFTGGIGSWSAVNGASIAATGGKGVITSMGGNFYAGATIADVVKKGVNYRLALGLSDFVGGTTVKITDSGDALIATADSAFTSIDFTAQNSGALYIVRGGDPTTSVSLDNVTLTPLGAEFAMDPNWDGRGSVVPNIAGTGNHGILPSSGVYPTNAPSVRGEKAPNAYAAGAPILVFTLQAGTSYTADQVLAETDFGAAPAIGMWRLDTEDVCSKYYLGGRYSSLAGSDVSALGSGGYIAGDYDRVKLSITAGKKIQILANGSFTQGGTLTVRLYHLDGLLNHNLVK